MVTIGPKIDEVCIEDVDVAVQKCIIQSQDLDNRLCSQQLERPNQVLRKHSSANVVKMVKLSVVSGVARLLYYFPFPSS